MTLFVPYDFALTRAVNTVTIRTATRVLAAGMLFIIVAGGVADGSEHEPEATSSAEAGEHVSSTEAASENAVEAAAPKGAVVGEASPSHKESADSEAVREADSAAGDEEHDFVPAATGLNGLKSSAEKIEFLRKVGNRSWKSGDREMAERYFATALNVNGPAKEKRQLMLDLAELYKQDKKPVEAIAILEKFNLTLPLDKDTPKILLELGMLYRETGAMAPAIARFFLVLNSTLRIEADELTSYKNLAMKARLEIAETYAKMGDFERARRYFSRLEVLDLDEADRERVVFRGAQLQCHLKQWFAAERQLAEFVKDYPHSANVPEARYLRAKALEKLDRKPEAVKEVLALLQSQETPEPGQLAASGYWKRRTGNELANRFYEQGDIMGALSIYQALARASEDRAWRWPAVYQIGLCFERLNLPERAVEAYKVITSPDNAPGSGESLTESLEALQTMAKWRLTHLDWVDDFQKGLQELPVEHSTES